MKLRELINQPFEVALRKLAQQKVPAVTAFKLAKLIKSLSEHKKLFDDTRLDLIKKYAVLDDKGEVKVDEQGNVEFSKEEDKVELQNQLEELLDQEIPVEPVKLGSLGNIEIDAATMFNLGGLIEE
jgi:hypothetical protein